LQESSSSIAPPLGGRKERAVSTLGRGGGKPAKPQGGPAAMSRRLLKKKPDRVCAKENLSEMRARQDRETHLKRHSDLAGSRERISTTRSSGR
jgi:hypothetical protein